MSKQWIEDAIKNAVEVHILQIRPGDTILHSDGQIRTVCPKDITYSSFMGFSLFGNNYNSGTIPVKNLYFKKKGGHIWV